MEKYRREDVESPTRSPSPRTKYSKMSIDEFNNLIMLRREKTRFDIVYFILNTLNHILYTDQWYCYCEDMGLEQNGVISKPRLQLSHCQVCKIPSMFPDFEKNINDNLFNMEILNKYYDELTKQLLKIFEKKPAAIECIQGEYVYSGRDWNSGKYWHVLMTESIRYSDGIH